MIILVFALFVLLLTVFTLAKGWNRDEILQNNLNDNRQKKPFIIDQEQNIKRVLPVEHFESIQGSWSTLKNLIILPAHAIQWCGEFGMDANDERCWYLESFQHGQV